MNRLLGLVITCAFLSGAANVQAQVPDSCEYDALGTILSFQPPFLVGPNGKVDGVTFGAQNGWWNDDLMGCHEAYKAPSLIPILPRCDQDGNGIVDIDWLVEMYYFMETLTPSASAVYSTPCRGLQCEDLAGISFMDGTGWPVFLGAAIYAGVCTDIYGNKVPGHVQLFPSISACESACGGCQSNADCASEEYCNFDGTDCGSTGNGTCIMRPTGCIGIYDPVCGCDGQTHSNACVAPLVGVSVDYDGECNPWALVS